MMKRGHTGSTSAALLIGEELQVQLLNHQKITLQVKRCLRH